MKKKLPKKTADITALEDAGVKHAKLGKDGQYEPRSGKKGATHAIVATKSGTITEPLGKAPKPPKDGRYGKPRIPDEPVDITPPGKPASWHPEIPAGATHVEYATSMVSLVLELSMLEDLRDFRGGTLRFGKLRYGEDFISLMPGEEGQHTNEDKEICVKKPAPAPHIAVMDTTHPKPAPVKPAPPRKDDVPGVFQNGVRKPGEGGKTARVWAICDELLAKLGRPPTKAEVLAISVDKEKASPGMSATNFSYWRRFYNHPKA